MTADLEQQPDRVSTGIVSLVGVGVVLLTVALVAIAWWLVVPPPATAPLEAASPLEHELYERATGGAAVRLQGAQRLERYEWVDRRARIVRIPIERAIDAVVAEPALIDSAIVGEVAR